MTRIDFYILDEQANGNRYVLACRLAEKIYHQGRRIFINTASEDEQRHMDRLLWTFRQGSFVPHGMKQKIDPGTTPVIIGRQGDIGGEDDVMINLAAEVPDGFSRFQRVAEVIDREPQIKAAGRERFRYYRDRGYRLNTHRIQ